MEPLGQAVFAIYILMHVVFTPIDGPDHSMVQYKAKVMNVGLSSQQCVAKVNELYQSGNYDLKTNSFGCIRVVHPQDEQRNNQMQRRNEGSH
jgi:hypothetical protein